MKERLKRIPLLPYVFKRFRYLYRRLVAPYQLKRLAKRRPLKIVIGASSISEPGWITTEIEYLNLLKPEDWERYFQPNSIDAILAEHVWEHLTLEQGVQAAKTCLKYLRPKGYLRVAVPDGLHPNPTYIEWVRPGGIGVAADDHKVLYTYQSFRKVFESAGFKTELLEYFDKEGEFHAREWEPTDGMIHRSKRFDGRNRGKKLAYTSIVLDATKPH